jgi:hypothetical protein
VKSKLTQIQEELAKAYILHHGNQSEAYRTVYPDNKSTTKSIWELSSRAFSSVKVQSRIIELQELSLERHLITVEGLTTELEEARDVAKEEGQAAAMATATMGKAKLHGLLTDKVESKVTVDVVGDFLSSIKPTTGIPSDRDK